MCNFDFDSSFGYIGLGRVTLTMKNNIYYSICVDAIVNIKKNPMHKKDWKFFSMFCMTLINTLNLGFVLMLVHFFFHVNIIWVRITIFPLASLNSLVSYTIQFASPFILLNYVLIFYRKRYKRLIIRYPDKEGKLFAAYLLISILLFVALIISYMCFR